MGVLTVCSKPLLLYSWSRGAWLSWNRWYRCLAISSWSSLLPDDFPRCTTRWMLTSMLHSKDIIALTWGFWNACQLPLTIWPDSFSSHRLRKAYHGLDFLENHLSGILSSHSLSLCKAYPEESQCTLRAEQRLLDDRHDRLRSSLHATRKTAPAALVEEGLQLNSGWCQGRLQAAHTEFLFLPLVDLCAKRWMVRIIFQCQDRRGFRKASLPTTKMISAPSRFWAIVIGCAGRSSKLAIVDDIEIEE